MKRILSMLIDIGLIIVYGLLLLGINLLFVNQYVSISELTANLLGISAMIIPAGVYFCLMEKHFGYTLGKRIMGLRVSSMNNDKLKLYQVVVRTSIFIVPWVVGHVFVYRGFYSDWTDSWGLTILAIMAYGLLLANCIVMIFRKDHRGYHEIFSYTKTTTYRS